MILLFGNIVDAWVIKTEISEMKLSIGAVGVRLFVPMWINMSCGCSSFGLISSCKTVRTCVIVGDLLKCKILSWREKSMFHCCPRALSIGSLSRSRFLIVLSSAGWQPIHLSHLK